MLISSAVVAVLGILMVEQISRGMVQFHRAYAIEEVNDGRSYALQRLQQLRAGDLTKADAVLKEVTANLSDRGERAKLFEVSVEIGNPGLPKHYVANGRPAELQAPAELTALVDARNVLGYQYVSMKLGGQPPRPVLAMAAPVSTRAGLVNLYYFFPLDGQVDSVALVRHVTFGVGVLLVLALGGIAFGVVRMVVRPVSAAARTAERLSAGVLTERMPVHGEDEVARLGRAFNQMAESLQQQIMQLERYSNLQRRFTSDVSHELRTPLTTIQMATDVLHRARGEFRGEVARSAELLHDQVEHFQALLADLLEISRYDGGFAVLEPEPTDVVELLRQAQRSLSAFASGVGVRIALDAPAHPVVCELDSRRVARIIANLVSNAVEYGRAVATSDEPTSIGQEPVVRMTLMADRHAVAVTVRDYGVGLAPHEYEAVFHRFWRGDPSRARHTGGTGLGLSIALEDTRLHRGWLQAWGQRGQGAQFRLTLPRHAGGVLESSPLPLVPEDAIPDAVMSSDGLPQSPPAAAQAGSDLGMLTFVDFTSAVPDELAEDTVDESGTAAAARGMGVRQ
ncbi:MAG: two-component sensor histidine kinase [Acidimicrobiales bacterium]|nr:MAG: two-component sensor histidine kinase [Acidimicrobiales bacterium]